MNMKFLPLFVFGILVLSMSVFASPAAACRDNDCREDDCCRSHDLAATENRAFIGNMVVAEADTGGNWAGGSEGGDGGDGGAITAQGEEGEVEESATGDGGTGGNGDIGGTVMTGNATAEANADNTANTGRALIDRCACEGEEGDVCDDECGHTLTLTRNRAMLLNGVMAKAETGENDAEGSEGGEGGDGGAITADGCEGEVEETMTGNGAAGGAGGEGGMVTTGTSRSVSGAINVVNRTVTRIMR